MEASGAVMLFQRSIEKIKLRYTPFVGDGDSKAYTDVCKAEPYGPAVFIPKEECISHVTKRMGTALRNLVKDWKECFIAIIRHRSLQNSIIKFDWRGRDRSPGRNEGREAISRRKIVLLSKKKEILEVDVSSDDGSLGHSPWSPKSQKTEEEDNDDGDIEWDDTSPDNHQPQRPQSLIGTSQERMKIIYEMDKEYEASLAADKEKMQQRNAEKEDSQIVISVRHIDLGVISRAFATDSKVLALYDWVGSLADTPEHFSLKTPSPATMLYLDVNAKKLASSMLYMLPRDDPVPLAKEDSHYGDAQGMKPESRDDTTYEISDTEDFQLPSTSTSNTSLSSSVDIHVASPLTQPPQQLMEGDDDKLSHLDYVAQKRSNALSNDLYKK
ncbi:hypothetical protein QZH41_000274 [Actinostola sp. cb2023]|nr:hypothetical protein QZH41_000274 [Actinostola sp. cb2023]